MRDLVERLKGEGETKIIRRVRARKECEQCGEPAVYRNTYLAEGERGARSNPASSAYGKDDCSWCSDLDQFLCGDCHQNRHEFNVPEGFRWCSTFTASNRFAHMFLAWIEVDAGADELARLRAEKAELVAALEHGRRHEHESGLLGFAIGVTRSPSGMHTELSDSLEKWENKIDAALSRAQSDPHDSERETG